MTTFSVATAPGRWRAWRVGASTAVGSFVVVATLLAGANFATAAPSRLTQSRATYCKLLSSFNKKENAAREVYSSITSPVSSMKAAYKALNGVAVLVLHVAPGPLKVTYAKEVNSLHQVYSDLANVNFNYLSLPENEIMTFESIQTSVSTATKKISTFDKKYCSAKG